MKSSLGQEIVGILHSPGDYWEDPPAMLLSGWRLERWFVLMVK